MERSVLSRVSKELKRESSGFGYIILLVAGAAFSRDGLERTLLLSLEPRARPLPFTFSPSFSPPRDYYSVLFRLLLSVNIHLTPPYCALLDSLLD